MGARKLVVATAAEIGDVARGAAFPIDRGVLAVRVISPAAGVRDGQHDLMARLALLNRTGLRRHVRVADKTFCAWRGSFRTVVLPEALGMEVGPDVLCVTCRSRARLVVGVARLAVRHAVCHRDCFRRLMASHAIDHLRQAHAAEAAAGSDVVVTGGTTEIVLIADFEVGRVRELNIFPLPRNLLRSHHPPLLFDVAGLLGLFRHMASAAVGGHGVGTEERLDSRFGMASGALWVRGEGGECAF